MERLKKIDIHVHTAKTHGLPRKGGETYAVPDELLKIYDKVGIEKGVILPEICVECAYDTVTNREVIEIVEERSDRFAWFCNLDPRMGKNSEKTDFSYFLNYYKEHGAKGVGELAANLYFDDPRFMNLFAHCEKCDMPIIFHIGKMGGDYGIVDDFGLPRLEKVLKTFPNLMVIGHSQKFWTAISGDITPETWGDYPTTPVVPGGRLIELLRRYPNLHCDLSAGSGCNAMMRDPEFAYAFMTEFQDRIFYGTDICAPSQIDHPMLKLAEFLDEAMETGKISYAAYEKISRGNALKLLNR